MPLYDLEDVGIANNDTVLTAFVHRGVQRASEVRFRQAADMEKATIVTRQPNLPVASMDFAAFTPCLTVDSATLTRRFVRPVEKA